ncbi:MAG TPA: hypothetical protein PLE92_01000 [Lentisphaeria bacterium]|nr:hypothetical protein [Lentisphaerota bacterium]OQC17051.1 MAG: hypothetical protein BWX73_00572 [Lentisphaerae bacterium ADurb.Bin082]HPY91051.1 hypothetical protein [Lentisphaeria bacterium]HQC51682.1 hypothetical protein [Lentisphaeria bacterium]HQL86043.1 hypothetical protein [Lentisphaeria bacterium]
MKKLLSVVFAAVVVIVSGCASTQVTELADLSGMKLTSAEEPIAHINAQNWGFYFLSIPLITGSAENPGRIAFFSEDSVTVPKTVSVMTQKAKELNASKVTAISSDRSSLMIPFPFPFLFYMRSTNVSGNAVR